MSIKVTKHGRYAATIQRGMKREYLGVWRQREAAEYALRAAREFVVSEKLCRREKGREARLARHAVHQGALWDKSKRLDIGELKRRLDYDSGSGLFRWKGGRLDYLPERLVGGIAGKVHKPSGYVTINISGRAYRAHRLAWLWEYGEWPRHQIDHKNHVRWDNRIENLREADSAQQMWNQRVRRDGLKGCYYSEFKGGKRKERRSKPWRATIQVRGVRKRLGWFHTEEEAHRAYAAAAREHFGEYMCLE